MNRGKLILRTLWLLALLLLTGCEDGLVSGTLIFEGTHQFGSETALPGDVLVQAGTVEFATGSTVAGSVYVVGGEVVLNGTITGDLVVLDGQVTLGPQAVVEGDLRLGGAGAMQSAETAVVQGETITGLALSQTRPESTGWDDAARRLVGALLLAALGGLWARRRPHALHHVAEAATVHWPAAGALGLLALLVLPVLLVMMAFTVVLLPLVLLLGLAIFLALGMGIIALGNWLGEWFWAWRKWPDAPGWTTFGGTLLLVGLFHVPWLGNGLFLVTAVLLFGAVLLSRFGTRSFEPPPHLAQREDLTSYGRMKDEEVP
jgi:hypothetical protein